MLQKRSEKLNEKISVALRRFVKGYSKLSLALRLHIQPRKRLMQWPEHFPSGCPPQTANNTSGEVYRLINHDSPTPDDFRSWREENKNKDCPEGVTECQACGLSVYIEKADACRVIRRIPRFKKAKPALGKLTPDLGVILHTPSRANQSHHTWWTPIGTQPWTVFQVVDVSE